jgi:hypothetical protein
MPDYTPMAAPRQTASGLYANMDSPALARLRPGNKKKAVILNAAGAQYHRKQIDLA